MGKEIFRIAHLSDLHCDASVAWEKSFSSLQRLVVNQLNPLPDLIVITGDLVDRPKEKYFRKLLTNIVGMMRSINNNNNDKKVRILTVPGNHDYYWFKGVKLFGASKKYHEFVEELEKHIGMTVDEIKECIYKENNIALYLIDSNSIGTWQLAQGHILDPLGKLDSEEKFYTDLDRYHHSKSLRVALLHHHPISQGDYKRKWVWQSMLDATIELQNSNSFLYAVAQKKIHMVLHGHKHSSGTLHIGFPEGYEDNQLCPIAISSCGTSCKHSESYLEVKVYDVKGVGDCDMHVYRATPGDERGFQKVENNRATLVYERERRRALSSYHNNLSSKSSVGIIKARTKSKHINILETGAANTEITYFGLELDGKGSMHEITERFRLDSGRVTGGEYAFETRNRVLDESARIWSEWKHPMIAMGSRPSPHEPEIFEVPFQLSSDMKDIPDKTLQIVYHQQNGYALNADQHEEIYGIGAKHEGNEFENCSIQANFPTESIELAVRFPDGSYPDPTTFRVYVFQKVNVVTEPGYGILMHDVPKINEEKLYLEKIGAMTIRPSLNEVSLRVENPRLDAVYSLHWEVDSRGNNVALHEFEEEFLRRLRDKFLNPDNAVTSFHEELQQELQKYFNDDSLQVFLLGYNQDDCTLKVTVTPDANKYSTTEDIKVGRGVAGAAFIRRTATYWDKLNDKASKISIEDSVSNLKPSVVLAFPISYPWSFSDLLPGRDQDNHLDPWPFAVVSIVSEKISSKLFLSKSDDHELDDDVIEERVVDVYKECDRISDLLIQIYFGELVLEHIPQSFLYN